MDDTVKMTKKTMKQTVPGSTQMHIPETVDIAGAERHKKHLQKEEQRHSPNIGIISAHPTLEKE